MSLDLRHLYAAYADESWEAERDADLHRANGRGKFAPWERDIERLLVRNDQLRRLMATAKLVGWCVKHNSIEVNGATCMAWEQAYSATAEPWEVEIDCHIVSKFLVDPHRITQEKQTQPRGEK